MGFEKGHKKLGGRPKGGINKTTVARLEILQAAAEDFASKLKANAIDPIGHIAKMLPLCDSFEQCQIMLALLKHQYPTVKPVESKAVQNPFAGKSTAELLELMREGVKFLEEQESAK